ncbi:MAG: phage tail protein [Agrobacterium cavarae]
MSLKRILWLIVLLLISAGAAKADPITAIVAGAKAIFTVATIVKAAISIAISVGMSLYQQAKARKEARKNKQQSTGGVTLSIQMGESVPRAYIIGTRASAGRRAYIGAWGEESNTPNAYITEVTELSCLPSFAGPQGLESVWFGETLGTILWDQPHPDGRGHPVLQFRREGVDYLWVKYLDGTQTTADAFLLSKFGARALRPWKSTMIGRGCQVAILTARRHEELFRNGFPQGLYQPKPMRLYDVSKDSSKGGNGAHRWENPETWETSNILPVMIYNIARGIYYGDQWVHGGRNFSSYRFPVSSWIAAINEAKRDMGNGRQQFRGGLEVFVDRDSVDVIEDLRVGCNGRMAEVGGRVKCLVGAPGAAVYSFSDRELVVTQDQSFEPFPTVAATHNTITGVYPEPAQRWTDKDAPEQSSQALLDRDGGERLSVAFQFDAVPFSAQVQSLTATMIQEEQRWRVHDLVLPPNAAALEPNDVVAFSSVENGYSDKKFLISSATAMPGRLQRVVIKEIDPSDYTPPSVILPPVIGSVGPVSVPPQPMYGWQVLPATLPDSAGNPYAPSIEVRCAPNQDDVKAVRVQVKLAATDALVFDSGEAIAYGAPYRWILNAVLAGNADYLVRGKFIPYTNRATEWSAELAVRTPNVGRGDLANLGDDVKNVLQGYSVQLREFWQRLEKMGRAVILEGALSQVERDEILVKVGNAFASIDTAREVAATADEALARQITTVSAGVAGNAAKIATEETARATGDSANANAITALTTSVKGNTAAIASEAQARADALSALASQVDGVQASFGDVSAGGLVSFKAVAAPSGVDVRIASLLRTSVGGVEKSAGEFLEIYTENGVQKARKAFNVDQFVVTDGVNSYALLAIENGEVKILKAKFKQAQIEDLYVKGEQIEPGAVSSVVSVVSPGGQGIVSVDLLCKFPKVQTEGDVRIVFDAQSMLISRVAAGGSNRTGTMTLSNVTTGQTLRTLSFDQAPPFAIPASWKALIIPAQSTDELTLRLSTRGSSGAEWDTPTALATILKR